MASLIRRLGTEFAYLRGSLRVLRAIGPIAKRPTRTIGDVLDQACRLHADRTAILSGDVTLTYRDFAVRVNRFARWARAQGIGKGDTVALFMGNGPDYLCLWLGVARAGGATALINTNLTGQALAHSLALVGARALVLDPAHAPAFAGCASTLEQAPELWVHGGDWPGARRLEPELDALPGHDLAPEEKASLTIEDRCLFIYTSGTTGLPKAANINHYRIMAMGLGFAALMGVRPDDRMYDCLPMYHSNGGTLATLGTLTAGGSVVIRERFSASDFWRDVAETGCTLFFYIGELCRYLVTTPPGPHDRAHRIRLVCGNGLRPDIWETFVARFKIPEVREFYAATEGNVVLFNLDSRPGSIGRIPKWAEKRFVVRIVRFDVEQEQPMRGPDGFCIPCGPDEVGEVVGQIVNDPARPANRFEGYADKSSTERKILRDCFEPGDAWFRSGDLMRRDRDGYFFFVDRIGDTFRWKGENVATSQVSEAITAYPGVQDCTVYGVRLEGYEGRAGMAALVLDPEANVDLDSFRDHLGVTLPDYARPLFLRFRDALDVTGTFKQRKVNLVEEGADPSRIADALFFDHPVDKHFVRLDAALWDEIRAGRFRL